MRDNPRCEGQRWLEQAQADLDSHYIPTRYPNGLPDDIPARVYNRAVAASALDNAEAIVAEVETWFADTDLPEKSES